MKFSFLFVIPYRGMQQILNRITCSSNIEEKSRVDEDIYITVTQYNCTEHTHLLSVLVVTTSRYINNIFFLFLDWR